ncbi:hypothetical protein BRD03_02060 [Halobacteriales archaeon QS_9_68_17]|nr:MAG: hypothetical protein BRD03_02060 [Halobacteriales archaeon QS_9_68_17]
MNDALVRRIRIRKTNGALTVSEWYAYEFAGDSGLVVFDPAKDRDDTGRVSPDRTGHRPPSATPADRPETSDDPPAEADPTTPDAPDADAPGADADGGEE